MNLGGLGAGFGGLGGGFPGACPGFPPKGGAPPSSNFQDDNLDWTYDWLDLLYLSLRISTYVLVVKFQWKLIFPI